MPYIARNTLIEALERLKATSDHMIKIWFTLKQMGMTTTKPVYIDTTSPNDALKRLFSYGSPDGQLYVPFAHTVRYMTMKGDAGRSIIQTNIRRWGSSGSVVTVDPTNYLQIKEMEDDRLEVKPGRNYPLGLGYGKNGFALEENGRVVIPLLSFSVWYYRQNELPTDSPSQFIIRQLHDDLNLTSAEAELVFTNEELEWSPQLQHQPLSDQEVYEIVQATITAGDTKKSIVVHQSFEDYTNKVRSMVTLKTGPSWLNIDPEEQLRRLIEGGSTAILLYGPPRTGKTRAVDNILSRNDERRETIQIHDGWGYDELIIGLRPQSDGTWAFKQGPLLDAIRHGKTCIVLEEINRTEFSQAIGEIFSLIEKKYRGQANKIRLRDGSDFFIPDETIIIFTMNTLDRSTEDVDDALFGRVDAVEFPPRVENLHELLQNNQVKDDFAIKIRELFAVIQQYYPLGHGYFASFEINTDPITFYLSRLRPVLQKHLKDYRDNELAAIDEKVNQLFV